MKFMPPVTDWRWRYYLVDQQLTVDWAFTATVRMYSDGAGFVPAAKGKTREALPRLSCTCSIPPIIYGSFMIKLGSVELKSVGSEGLKVWG